VTSRRAPWEPKDAKSSKIAHLAKHIQAESRKTTQSKKVSSLLCFLCFFKCFAILHTRSEQSSRIDKSIVFMMFFLALFDTTQANKIAESSKVSGFIVFSCFLDLKAPEPAELGRHLTEI